MTKAIDCERGHSGEPGYQGKDPMNTSSGKAPHPIQFGRRSTTTTRIIALIGCCLIISAVVVVSSRANSALRSSERLHKRNKFFNPAAVPHGSADPCVLGLNVT